MAAGGQVQHDYDQQMASYIIVLAVLVYELLAISDTLILLRFHPCKACDRGFQEINACFCWTESIAKTFKEHPKDPTARRKVSAQFDISSRMVLHISNQKQSLSYHQGLVYLSDVEALHPTHPTHPPFVPLDKQLRL